MATIFQNPLFLDPLDIEIEPGFKVRDIKTVDDCVGAITRLELQIGTIKSQIARDEQNPGQRGPGWRSSAQNAIGWKKRAKRAIRLHREALIKMSTPAGDKRRLAILKVITEEIGMEAMDEYVRIAQRRYPDAFRAPVDNGDSGENR